MNLGGRALPLWPLGRSRRRLVAGCRVPLWSGPSTRRHSLAFVGGPAIQFVDLGRRRGGGVAWFPSGPREVYVPTYRASPPLRADVNVNQHDGNVTNVTNVYNNVERPQRYLHAPNQCRRCYGGFA